MTAPHADRDRDYRQAVDDAVPAVRVRRVMTLADQEQAELRAEVERQAVLLRALEREANARDAAEARVAELEATVAKVRELAREAAEAIVSGHSHWDSTMRYGAGCDTCQSQRDKRDRLLAILDAPKGTTAP